VKTVVAIDEDCDHPDCCFVEDTAFVVGSIAVICLLGHASRRGEEVPVERVLGNLVESVVRIQGPATIDGGDVLQIGNSLFIGLSSRTNTEAVAQLKSIFRDTVNIFEIPVVAGLHLKSVVSAFSSTIIVTAEGPVGDYVGAEIQKALPHIRIIKVRDQVASNVLRIGSTLIIQDGYPESEAVLENLCDEEGVQVVKLNMSELIKADGALTCCSILFDSTTT
jgi:dimethylargininase